MSNLVNVCAQHHKYSIHFSGSVALSGEAPHDLHWELGRRKNRPPLWRLIGDEYVTEEN
jgi:hypothetical protein